MSIEDVLAKNLDALMAAYPEFNSQLKLSKASGVGQTTVGRIRRADGAATIDNVAKIAKVFRVSASQMLDPQLATRIGSLAKDHDGLRAMALAVDIQEANLSDNQLTILENTLAAMRSR